jgi:hypothetical protein
MVSHVLFLPEMNKLILIINKNKQRWIEEDVILNVFYLTSEIIKLDTMHLIIKDGHC